ncbi:MAG: CRISPR-associated ring nuclease [Thermoplasmata archaeon]
MVASEMVDFFKSGYNKNLKDVIIIMMDDERIKSGSYMAGSAIKSRYEDVFIHYKLLNLPDITNEKDINEFIDKIGEIIKKEKDEYSMDKIYANITGGRKIESVVLSNFSQLLGIDEVWVVLNPVVTNYNIEFEKILNELDNFKDDENVEYYKQNKSKFDPIFYPDLSKLSFFEVTTIKLPLDDLMVLKQLLKGGINFKEMGISDYKRDAFVKSKLIGNNKKESNPTELGDIIYKYI